MNHVKCILNTNVPRRVSSNTGITRRSNCKSEESFKKRSAKLRSPTIENSFMLAVKKVYPLLIQRYLDDTRLGDKGREMLYGTQGSKSKSIASSLRRLLSERKLPLRCIDGTNAKQAVRFGSSSSLSYDRTINYDDDKDSKSYAQMITAYNETMMTVDNSSSILQDQSNSKLNVQLSKTLFKTTSTLTSSAYNFENVRIKENTEETSMTDSSYAIDTIIDNDDGFREEKTKNLDVYSPSADPTTNVRSYANIIADYSAAMDVNSIMNKYRKDFPKMSNVSVSSPKATSVETPRVERNVSEFVSSSELKTDSRKMNAREELEWLRKVDKIINDLKTTTEKTNTKVNQKKSGLQQNDVLECVTEQAVWVDKSTLNNTKKSNVLTERETVGLKDRAVETQNREARAERAEKTAGSQLSQIRTASSNFDSTSRKDWTKVPKSTETGNPSNPQVELRMAPSGNESIVSVNVEAIAKAMESRNPDSKELSVTVSSNKEETMKHHASKENTREGNTNFGSMRISISEESLPVKELELSINGKPISDVRSIKARTETLNVTTSMDKVEIRVPYLQGNPGKVSPNTKSFVKNVQSAESVLKLRIATAFDGPYPVLTTGVTKNAQVQSNIQPNTPKARYAHTEGSNANTKLSEAQSTTKNQSSEESSVKRTEKSDDTSSKKTFGYNVTQDKSGESAWARVRNKYLQGSHPSTSHGGGDVNKSEISGDIDLRLTKTFGRFGKTRETDSKTNTVNATEVKKSDSAALKTTPDGKKAGFQKDVKSASEKDGVKSLADLIAKHSGRSTDDNSPAASGKPKLGSNQNREGSKPPGNKRDSKATDEVKKKTTLNNQSSKADMFDQRISSKWSPWWSASDTYVKLKKEEDYRRDYPTQTNVTEKQKAKEFDSMDKVPSKTTKESLRASEEEKTLSAKSQDPSKSKEKKHETKESSSASSKMRDVERTLKSPFKSENIRVTRYDSGRVNEKSKRHSFSSRTKIAEEKLNKRNEGPSKKETRNASMSKEVESEKNVDARDDVKVPIKGTPKIDATLKTVDIKNQAQENVMNAKSMDRLEKEDEKTRNEKLIRQKTLSTNSFPETQSNIQQNVKKKDATSDSIKPTKSENKLSDEDSRLKEILNSMKPIEKKKDGILIDYGVKVASRQKPEKLKGRPTSNVETSKVMKAKEIGNQRFDSRSDIKTSYSVQQINANMQNSINYSPRNVEFKEEDKTKKETVSAKDKGVKKDDDAVNLNESKKDSSSKSTNLEQVNSESLNERISKVLQRAKDCIQYQNVIKEPSLVKNVQEDKKLNEDGTKINSESLKTEKVAATDESLNERISKILQKSKDRIPYQNINKESSESSFKTEQSANVKKAKQNSNEDIGNPLEATVTPKSSPTSVTCDTRTESVAGTVLRSSSKDSEKKKSEDVCHKHSSNTINAIEKPNTPPTANIVETKTNKGDGESSGSQNNSGTPSGCINPNDSSSSKMTKSNARSPKSNDLEKPYEFDKLRYTDKIKQVETKSVDESVKPRRPDKELVYSVWLQRSKEKTDDKKP